MTGDGTQTTAGPDACLAPARCVDSDRPAVIAFASGHAMTNMVTDDVWPVRIGQRVVVHFEEVTDEAALPKFRLA